MYRHIKNYEIRYMDTDAFDNIKLSALLGILQESSCLSAMILRATIWALYLQTGM